MRSLVPLLLLLSVSIPLRAAIVAGSEQPVEPVTYVPGGGSAPVIASAGPDSLVAWGDALGIKAAVISAPGAVSPIPSRRIHRGDGSRSVSIVWTGRAYLLTWVDGNNTMMAGTVSRDGVPIAESVVMSGGGTWSGALAWNGRHALLAGASAQTQQSLGLLLDGDGNVVKRDIAIADLPDTSNVRVVAVNDVFDVFWEKTVAATSASITPPPLQFTTSVRVARVSDEGVSLDATGTIVTVTDQAAGNVGVAFDGHTLALSLMTVALPGQLQTLHRYLVDPRTFATTALPDIKANGTTSNMLWSGSAFVVYWSDYGFGYRFETVSFTGNESVPMNAVVDGLGSSSDVVAASTGSSIVMTWTDHARGGSDVMAMTLTPDGRSRTSDKFFVAYGAQAETLPAIAPGLVVWGKTLPSGLAELFASRIAADGSTIGAPIQLSTTGRVSPGEPPLVVFTGSIWFVAWGEASSSSNYSLAGTDTRRIALDGTLIDAKPVEIPNTAPWSIAFNGSMILMPTMARNGDLVAARFDANGNPAGNVTVATGVYAWSTSTASNSRDFLVTWTVGSDYWQFPSKDLIDIEGARVDAGGNVLDTTPIAIATGPADQVDPRVASNGADYLVAFLTPALVSNINMWQPMLQRVNRDGFVDGAPFAAGSPSFSPQPVIAGNASGYWILTKNDTLEPSLEAAHLDVSGVMTDHATIAGNVDPLQALAVTLLGNAALTAYARFDSATETTRVFTRHLTTGLLHGHAAGR